MKLVQLPRDLALAHVILVSALVLLVLTLGLWTLKWLGVYYVGILTDV